jgi:hypothetical protein
MKLKKSDLLDEIETALDHLGKAELLDLYNYLFPCKMIVHKEDVDWEEYDPNLQEQSLPSLKNLQ